MTYSVADREHMSRALELAAKARYTASPNPSVGCVLVVDGQVVGEGYTRPAGGHHAEIEALNAASGTQGAINQGATAYVTLEPCSHTGKTGPCAQALIDAGISRVVIACEDPNPKVAGDGIKLLQDAGIEVACGLYEDQAREINKGFIKRHEQGLPWVLVKTAASLDGRTAMASGQSQWITTPASRKDVQRLRAASCAIITGIGTQLMDDPSLTVRITNADVGVEDSLRQPLRVVVDSHLKMSAEARMFAQPGKTLVATMDGPEQREKAVALQTAGAEVVFLAARDGHGRLAWRWAATSTAAARARRATSTRADWYIYIYIYIYSIYTGCRDVSGHCLLGTRIYVRPSWGLHWQRLVYLISV